MLEEFIVMHNKAPLAYYHGLMKDGVPMTDILKITRAIKQLRK